MLYQAHFREVLWATGPTSWKEPVGVILAMLLVQDFAFGNPEQQNRDIHTTNAHIMPLLCIISYSSPLFPMIPSLPTQ